MERMETQELPLLARKVQEKLQEAGHKGGFFLYTESTGRMFFPDFETFVTFVMFYKGAHKEDDEVILYKPDNIDVI